MASELYTVSVTDDVGGMAVFAASTSAEKVQEAVQQMTLLQSNQVYIASGPPVRIISSYCVLELQLDLAGVQLSTPQRSCVIATSMTDTQVQGAFVCKDIA